MNRTNWIIELQKKQLHPGLEWIHGDRNPNWSMNEFDFALLQDTLFIRGKQGRSYRYFVIANFDILGHRLDLLNDAIFNQERVGDMGSHFDSTLWKAWHHFKQVNHIFEMSDIGFYAQFKTADDLLSYGLRAKAYNL